MKTPNHLPYRLHSKRGDGIKRLTHFIVLALILTGCASDNEQTNSTENPTAEEILNRDSEANILLFNETVYQTNIDWVDELTLTKGEQIGEIEAQATEGNVALSEKMSTKVSVGSAIFEAVEREDVLIVDENGELYYFYALVEG
ncbi:hypothetical protein JOC54_000108 [Alkalihalobacillus xiaoxiensis]|uniref:Uncharacterized protein n=1 Tax=Shouchella xiaoxiensis TaxID=766895 RepID=A0ABS2SRJ2_9BACI|nr:hypothetical protein [Shouchella xiaoxiensis]MBM7836877.1 hypothetical protein [Shouchella xiaoxiensis]